MVRTFNVSVDNSLTFQVAQSFENMSEQHSVVTKYDAFLILIYCHIIQHTGQTIILYELLLKVFYKYKYINIIHTYQLWLNSIKLTLIHKRHHRKKAFIFIFTRSYASRTTHMNMRPNHKN